MPIYWFTQPANSFASCYLYDQETHEFCRVRLELNRDDNHGTFVSYYATRAVGFVADGQNYRTSQNQRWTINDANRLCYNGAPLPQDPVSGMTVFDSTDPASFVHRGNPITNAPVLPPGISQAQLRQLADLVRAEGPDGRVQLTARDATPQQLAQAIVAAIQARV
ncbi:hypothetical protein [Yokenella regensburgei]|uniref:hypothetical protein n=1 Tax=Yokenella regensburgei TaxID=158877 RepID=UPI0003051826|nr:hypothetical protein [Yokenella regensburgei]KAF1370474.1 hypothetical protein FHR25_000569 [Yokenella regensburgei]